MPTIITFATARRRLIAARVTDAAVDAALDRARVNHLGLAIVAAAAAGDDIGDAIDRARALPAGYRADVIDAACAGAAA